jgi:hypothetical protein
MEQGGGQLRLYISYAVDAYLFAKVTDAFVALLLEELLKPVGTKIIEKLFDVFFLSLLASADVEVDTDVESDPHIIFGGHICDWALEPNGVFGDHHTDLFVLAVKHSAARIHDTVVLAEPLLHSVHTVGDIDLAIAHSLVFNDGHYWNTVVMVLRYHPWSFLGIVAVNLDQMGSLFEFTLHSIVELVDLVGVLLLLLVLPIRII